MSLKIEGTVKSFLEQEHGTSQGGKEWTKGGFILDTGAKYNPEICFGVFGSDKLEKLAKEVNEGDKIEVQFNLSSREFNGKYYHNVDAWAWKKVQNAEELPENEEDSPFPG